MLRARLSHRSGRLSYDFSVKNFLKNLFFRPSRAFSDTPQEQQKFALRNVDPAKPPIPPTTQAAQQAIQSTEREVNYLQEKRLKNIDKVLGTRTYFYDPKIYEIKLDSEHVMTVKRMKAQAFQDRLNAPLKYDSKINQDIKLRNRKKYWKNLAKMRQYPQHKTVDFNDESSASLLEFLAKEVLFTRMSFHSIEDLKSYFLKQDIEPKPYLLHSPKYVYYNIPNTPLLGRTLKSKFPENSKISQIPQSDVQVVMSLDEIYNYLLKHDNNPFVQQFLKDVENNTLKGTVTQSIRWTEDENHLIVLIDLTGEKKEFAILIKNLMSGLITDSVMDVAESLGVMGNRVFFVRRDSLEMLTELCYFDIESKGTHLVYKQSQQLMIRFQIDINGRYLYLFREQISDPWKQKIAVFGFQNKDRVVEIPTQPGFQYEIVSIEKGFAYCQYQRNDKGQYPPLFSRIAKELCFIPFSTKTELATRQEQRMLRKAEEMRQIIQKYNEIADSKIELRKPAKELVLSDKHEVMYKCEQNEAIESLLNMKNQIILNIIKSWGQPDYKPVSKLHIIPRKQHSAENSLVIPDQYISFGKVQDPYGQKVVFKLRNPLEPLFTFTTWNDQLQQDCPDTVHTETFSYQCRDGVKQSMSLYCQDIYKNKCLDAVILFNDQNEQEMDYQAIRCLLKKGILVAVFKGRGTIYGSLSTYQEGKGDSIISNINDLIDSVLSLHESGKTTNTGLYCKGKHPSNVAALCNILQPFLFTATVLHNGQYGFKQEQLRAEGRKYANQSEEEVEKPLVFSIPQLPFAGREKSPSRIEIDDISNILISTTSGSRLQSRKLIHYLRKGKKRYDEIYYKEAQSNRDADLTNLCFLYRILVDNSQEYTSLRDEFT